MQNVVLLNTANGCTTTSSSKTDSDSDDSDTAEDHDVDDVVDDDDDDCSGTDDSAISGPIMFSTCNSAVVHGNHDVRSQRDNVRSRLEWAVDQGCLPLVKFVLNAERPSFLMSSFWEASHLLPRAVAAGEWEIEAYLSTYFADHTKMFPDAHIRIAFGILCEKGELSRMIDLVERKGLCLSEFSPDDAASLLGKACRTDRLETAQWLMTTFRFQGRRPAMEPFALACSDGRFKTAKWLA